MAVHFKPHGRWPMEASQRHYPPPKHKYVSNSDTMRRPMQVRPRWYASGRLPGWKQTPNPQVLVARFGLTIGQLLLQRFRCHSLIFRYRRRSGAICRHFVRYCLHHKYEPPFDTSTGRSAIESVFDAWVKIGVCDCRWRLGFCEALQVRSEFILDETLSNCDPVSSSAIMPLSSSPHSPVNAVPERYHRGSRFPGQASDTTLLQLSHEGL
jgi:hypothetical protein